MQQLEMDPQMSKTSVQDVMLEPQWPKQKKAKAANSDA